MGDHFPVPFRIESLLTCVIFIIALQNLALSLNGKNHIQQFLPNPFVGKMSVSFYV